MDSKVKARFFQVDPVRSADPTFFDCLHALWEHPNREEYEELYGGVRVRIENFENNPSICGAGFVEGEFVRQQTENLPPVAEQGRPLQGNSKPLGHRCAFRYHAALNILLLEAKRGSVTPSRMDGLIKARHAPHYGFFLTPVLSEVALNNLRNGTPRRVTMRVARPSDMDVVENEQLGLEESLARLSNHFEGPNIEISCGWPRENRDGILSMRSINKTIRWAMGNRQHVEVLKVKVAEEGEPIDVFSEQLKGVKVLNLDSEDVARNYAARRDFLREVFTEKFATLERLYGRS